MLEAVAFGSKLLLYAATLGAAGAGLHQAAGLLSERRLLMRLGGLVAVAALVRLLAVNAQLGGSLEAAFSAGQLPWTWAGIGRQTEAFLLGAALLAVSARVRAPGLAALAAVVIAAGFGMAGHSAGLDDPGIAPFAVALHVLIAAFWFAAPWTLWPRPQTSDAQILGMVRRFSRVAVFVVPLLFASGVWLLWELAGSIDRALATLYGRLLLGKLALATAILGLGALNMTVVTRMLAAAPDSGRGALRATLRADAALFSGVLVLIASATSFTGPGE